MQWERENLTFRRLFADGAFVGVGDGRATPRELGRPNVFGPAQQGTAVDLKS